MRIAVLIPNCSGGGIARVASLLCSRWASQGHEVGLMTFELPRAKAAYDIHARVCRFYLGHEIANSSVGAFILVNLARLRQVRRTLKEFRPDVLLVHSTEASVIGVLAARSVGLPVVVYEGNNPAHHREGWKRELARRLVYPMSQLCVVQTRAAAAWYRDHLDIQPAVLRNPIDLQLFVSVQRRASERGDKKRLLGIGRLERQKGYDVLLEAFAMLGAEFPEWTLTILGEGQQRGELEDLVKKLGLNDGRVQLPGVVADVRPHLSVSDVFVHPARYEGLPNVLVEAMATGQCIVASECGGVVSEFIPTDAALVCRELSPTALAECLKQVMKDEATRHRMSLAAARAALSFDADAVASEWLDQFATLTTRPGMQT